MSRLWRSPNVKWKPFCGMLGSASLWSRIELSCVSIAILNKKCLATKNLNCWVNLRPYSTQAKRLSKKLDAMHIRALLRANLIPCLNVPAVGKMAHPFWLKLWVHRPIQTIPQKDQFGCLVILRSERLPKNA